MKHENMCAWSPEEDRIILEMYETSGRKWGKIASELSSRPNASERTSASVRNRYLRIEKGRQMRAEGKSKNRCAACGQQKLGHVCQARLDAAKAAGPIPLAPAAEVLALRSDAGSSPIAPVAEDAAETLASLSCGGKLLVAQAEADDIPQAEAWPVPKRLAAWRKHEAAARMTVRDGDQTQTTPLELTARPEEKHVEGDLLTEGKSKLRLERSNSVVAVLTKQPSGEVIMSMYMADKAAAATAAL